MVEDVGSRSVSELRSFPQTQKAISTGAGEPLQEDYGGLLAAVWVAVSVAHAVPLFAPAAVVSP